MSKTCRGENKKESWGWIVINFNADFEGGQPVNSEKLDGKDKSKGLHKSVELMDWWTPGQAPGNPSKKERKKKHREVTRCRHLSGTCRPWDHRRFFRIPFSIFSEFPFSTKLILPWCFDCLASRGAFFLRIILKEDVWPAKSFKVLAVCHNQWPVLPASCNHLLGTVTSIVKFFKTGV